MIELADSDVDAEDGGENEVKENVEHCCYVAFMRQLPGGGGRALLINAIGDRYASSHLNVVVGTLPTKPEAAPVLRAAALLCAWAVRG